MTFQGFGPKALPFFKALAFHKTREWFEAFRVTGVTAKLDSLRAEDEAVLRAGLAGAPFITVDDTGARHAGKGCFTTHIGSDRFAAFRTGQGKSRLAFLSRLLGGAARFVINAAA